MRREYGGNVYLDQNGVFSYTQALVEGPLCPENQNCSTGSPIPDWVPDGTLKVAEAHSHPFEGGSGNFGGAIGGPVYVDGLLVGDNTTYMGDRAGPRTFPQYVSQPIGDSYGIFLIPAGNLSLLSVCQLPGPSLAGINPCP